MPAAPRRAVWPPIQAISAATGRHPAEAMVPGARLMSPSPNQHRNMWPRGQPPGGSVSTKNDRGSGSPGAGMDFRGATVGWGTIGRSRADGKMSFQNTLHILEIKEVLASLLSL